LTRVGSKLPGVSVTANTLELLTKYIALQEPVTGFGNIDFELVCDSVDSIRVLLSSIEEEHNNAVEVKKVLIIFINIIVFFLFEGSNTVLLFVKSAE